MTAWAPVSSVIIFLASTVTFGVVSPTEPSRAALRRRVTYMELHSTEMMQAILPAIKAAATALAEPEVCACCGLVPQLCPQGGDLTSKGGDFCR